MIPIRLELMNFMSYGERVTPLDFRGMRLACLSGDNGNGKSAILDAITWVLWGEARASSDELIRLGSDEMRVTFDFELEGDVYRVLRGRSRRNSGNFWEVYRTDPSGEYRSISGQGMRETEKVIERLLRMDYKTFINSAYIQQGRADEFTKQTVSDRKKILADILDLGRYDTLEAKAKVCRAEAHQVAEEHLRGIRQIEEELDGEDETRAQFALITAERESLDKRLASTEADVRKLQVRRAELDSAANRFRELEQQVASWRREIQRLTSQRMEQEQRVARGREILGERDRIREGYAKLRSTRESVVAFDRRLQELRALDHERTELERSIQMEAHKLDLQRQSLAKELSDLENKIAAGSQVEKDIVIFRGLVKELDRLDARRSELHEEMTKQSDQLGLLKAQRDHLKDKVQPELEERLSMISQPDAKCPLCQTELGEEKHAGLIADYQKQIAEVERRIVDVNKQGVEARRKREEAQKLLQEIEEKLRAGLETRRGLAQAEQLLSSVDEYRKQIPDVRACLDGVAAKLESADFAHEMRKQLADVTGRISKLDYDADAHDRVRSELADLEQFEAQMVKLQAVEESLPSDEANLKSMIELIAAREGPIAESENSMGALPISLAGRSALVAEMEEMSSTLACLREADNKLIGRIATLKHSIERFEILREDVVEKRKMAEKAKRDKAVYTELVAAFGKRGVQALIIENAIPEIQEEANSLLARMTDNAMQVTMETVRDKKTGGTAETLDIKISDDLGTRSYELFSGGEAFRINFALRIALSKLLARRAGARLQTLIVDEGFGTQDAKGREKLVEAIDSIKDDFDKILVITHIDELKDAFPTRIEITKDENGSQISVE
jgi:exonuclease SbcC